MKKLLFLVLFFSCFYVYADETYINGKKASIVEIQEFGGLSNNPSVSPANKARMFYQASSDTLQVSLNGGAYQDFTAPLAHKTTEDALNGLVKVDGAGNYSAVTDNSANWDTAYGWGDHSLLGVYYIDGDTYAQTNEGIQGVIDSIPEGGVATIFLLEGQYNFTAPVLCLNKAISFVGLANRSLTSSPSVKIVKSGTSWDENDALIEITNNLTWNGPGSIKISNILFDGNGKLGPLLKIAGLVDSVLEDLTFYNTATDVSGVGLYLDTTSVTSLGNISLNRIKASNAYYLIRISNSNIASGSWANAIWINSSWLASPRVGGSCLFLTDDVSGGNSLHLTDVFLERNSTTDDTCGIRSTGSGAFLATGLHCDFASGSCIDLSAASATSSSIILNSYLGNFPSNQDLIKEQAGLPLYIFDTQGHIVADDIFGGNIITGSITTERSASSPATYFDRRGVMQKTITSNVPRVSMGFYDTSGWNYSPYLMNESASTNLITRTDGTAFSSGVWTGWSVVGWNLGTVGTETKTNIAIPELTAISGATSQRIQYTGVAGDSNGDVRCGISTANGAIANGDTVTVSMWVRSQTGSTGVTVKIIQQVRASNNATLSSNFSSDILSSLSTSWKRFSYTLTISNATASNEIAGIFVGNIDEGDTFDVEIYGVQVEKKSSATSFIPTTSESLTRNAETFTLDNGLSTGNIFVGASNITGTGTLNFGTVIASSISCSPTISSGTSTPTTTPTKVGDMFIDTSNKKAYAATGTASSDDWIILN